MLPELEMIDILCTWNVMSALFFARVFFHYAPSSLCPFGQGGPILVHLGEALHVAHDNRERLGSRQRNIHAAPIPQETDPTLSIGTHRRKDDYIPFAALVPIHRLGFKLYFLVG